MKIKLSELIVAKESLIKLFNQDYSAKTSFILSRVQRVIDAHLSDFQVANLSLFQKYGVLKNGQYTIETNNIEIFQKEYFELMGTEINLEIEAIQIEAIQNAKLSPSDINVLNWLIDA